MKPILFNTEMVRAILDGRKSVTRRVVKPQPRQIYFDGRIYWDLDGSAFIVVENQNNAAEEISVPYIKGDILYVRETWYYEHYMESIETEEPDLPSGAYSRRYVYKADCPDYPVYFGVGQHGWRPSIHMPKEAARLFLRVTDVRVERLQDITGAGALAEGCNGRCLCPSSGTSGTLSTVERDFSLEKFGTVWDSTIKKADLPRYGWDANPWVWVIEFERIGKEEALNEQKGGGEDA